MSRTLDAIGKLGIPVVVIRDNPTPRQNETLCLSRAVWQDRSVSRCETSRDLALDGAVTTAEQGMTMDVSGRQLVDLSDRICGKASCPALRDGMVVYRDANHLSDVFASSFLPQLETALAPLMRADAGNGHLPAPSR
jgi:hypothetical protein